MYRYSVHVRPHEGPAAESAPFHFLTNFCRTFLALLSNFCHTSSSKFGKKKTKKLELGQFGTSAKSRHPKLEKKKGNDIKLGLVDAEHSINQAQGRKCNRVRKVTADTILENQRPLWRPMARNQCCFCCDDNDDDDVFVLRTRMTPSATRYSSAVFGVISAMFSRVALSFFFYAQPS